MVLVRDFQPPTSNPWERKSVPLFSPAVCKLVDTLSTHLLVVFWSSHAHTTMKTTDSKTQIIFMLYYVLLLYVVYIYKPSTKHNKAVGHGTTFWLFEPSWNNIYLLEHRTSWIRVKLFFAFFCEWFLNIHNTPPLDLRFITYKLP